MVTSPQPCVFAHLVDMSSLVVMSFKGCTNVDGSEMLCDNSKPGGEDSLSRNAACAVCLGTFYRQPGPGNFWKRNF